MSETIFAKIIRGEIPCHRLYEDEHVLSFLDVGPLSEGHALVIPKEPAASLDQLSDESAAAVGRVLPRIARALLAATGARDFNVLQNNGASAHQAVFHVHFHIIPRFPDREHGGLGIVWKAARVDHEAAGALAEKVRASLE